MVVAGAEHDKFIGDVRGPGGSVMVGDASFECLPGSDDGLLGFVLRLERHSLARIFAIAHAGAGRGGDLTAEDDFVINKQTPTCGAMHPEAPDVGFGTARHYRATLAVGLL